MSIHLLNLRRCMMPLSLAIIFASVLKSLAGTVTEVVRDPQAMQSITRMLVDAGIGAVQGLIIVISLVLVVRQIIRSADAREQRADEREARLVKLVHTTQDALIKAGVDHVVIDQQWQARHREHTAAIEALAKALPK